MTRAGCPWPMAAKTNRSPLGLHEPADRIGCRLSNRAVAVVVTSLRVMAPVVVSARKRSSESRSRSEKKTAWRPSGLSDGPSCIRPAFASRSSGDGSSSAVAGRLRARRFRTQRRASRQTAVPARRRSPCEFAAPMCRRLRRVRISAITRSPKRPARYAHIADPYRYGENVRAACDARFGSRSNLTASRSHIAASRSPAPSDRYWAMPSTAHNGHVVSPPKPLAMSN